VLFLGLVQAASVFGGVVYREPVLQPPADLLSEPLRRGCPGLMARAGRTLACSTDGFSYTQTMGFFPASGFLGDSTSSLYAMYSLFSSATLQAGRTALRALALRQMNQEQSTPAVGASPRLSPMRFGRSESGISREGWSGRCSAPLVGTSSGPGSAVSVGSGLSPWSSRRLRDGRAG
jgi:hypothetical protein